MRTSHKSIILAMTISLALSACAPYHYQGGMAGGAMGGIAGALLDHRNPWRGGVIGATLGAIAGATIADISVQGAREAAYTGRPVAYTTEDRRGYYYAEPIGRDQRTGCRKVREQIYEDGRLVQTRVRIIYEEPYAQVHNRYDDYNEGADGN